MRSVRTGLGRSFQVAELLAPGEPRGHRTKIGLRIGGATGALTAGLFAPHTREVVAISECEVQDAAGTAFALRLVALASRLGVPPFEEESGRGLLRAVVVRVGHGTGELQVTWVLSARSQQFEPALTAAALEAGALSVALNFHAEDGKQLAGSRLVHAGGAARIRAEVCGQSYLVSAGAFFQTSKFGAEALSKQVRAWAGSAPQGRLLDLYSGLGFFGLPLASRFREVVAMEESHAATEDGIASAAGSGVRNISFREGRVESSLRAFLRSGEQATTVIADPPRSGLSAEVVEMLTSELAPERLVYVSCDLDALSRDVATLTQGGMQLEEVQPVEMFPMTKHVETVALFRPNPVLAMARRMGGRR
jgi:23S rRNA (uracil1939-C5)-methyltransferase